MHGAPYTSKQATTFLTVQPPVTIPVRGLQVTVSAAGVGVGFGTVVLAGLPQGNLLLRAAVCYLRFQTADTDVIAAFNGDFALGTTADADGNHASPATDADIVPSTALGPATARVTAFHRAQSAATGHLLTNNAMLIDNTASNVNLNLNVLIDAADITDAQAATLTVDGVVYLDCTILGDD